MKNAIEQHFIFQCFPASLHVLLLEIGALFQDVFEVLIRKHDILDLFYVRKLINQIYLVCAERPGNYLIYYIIITPNV